MTFSLNKSGALFKSPIYSKIQGNFKLIHEIFIKITHLGKKNQYNVYIITENCIPSYKKGFYFGKAIPNLWQVLLSEIRPQNNTI